MIQLDWNIGLQQLHLRLYQNTQVYPHGVDALGPTKSITDQPD